MNQSKKSIRVIFIIFAALFVACVYGAVNVVKNLNDKYNSERLKIALEQTSLKEGVCLTKLIDEYNLNYNNMAEFYKDACISIEVDSVDGDWLGSGVCIASKDYETKDGLKLENGSYIVTNYHVIQEYYVYDETEVYVYPNDFKNTDRYGVEMKYEADVLWSDSYLDIALIYVEENIDWVMIKDRSIEPEENENLKVDEKVFAIGTPQSLSYQNTITKGVIASSEPMYSYTTEESYFTSVMSNIYEDLIAMQVSIMGGNSGGGLFDENGYLVGLPTLGTENSQSSNAINYSIPIYPITLVLDDLITANENNNDIKIYSIDDLYFVVIDSLESEIMTKSFKTQRVYFYGSYYSRRDLSFDENGLKVLNSNSEKVIKGSIIEKAILNTSVYKIDDRNDLIYVLLKYKNDDMLSFDLKDVGVVNINLHI